MNDNEVINGCQKYIGQLNGLITSNQYNDLLSMCLSDLKATGDIIWVTKLIEFKFIGI